ncbi:MAG: hypothetical protein IJ730_07155 [Alphaproteobacteria bacterium]|nr:hypothetical protein [Alphaproteobacteria bacterium]
MDFSSVLGSISNVMSLGSFAVNLFTNNRKRQLQREQQGYYEWEAEINRRIGQLNAQAAEYSGDQAVSAIAAQTKKILSKQFVEFSNRGIELEGSPALVLGETETMGSREAQNAYFNAQVEKINYLYKAEAASRSAQNRADEARYGSYASMIDSLKGVKDGFQLMNSMFKSSTLNTSVTGSSNSTIRSVADASTGSNSPINSIIMNRMRIR